MAASPQPCRYKACGGSCVRPCPVAARIGAKASKTTPAALDALAIKRAKRVAKAEKLSLCAFCFGPAEDCATGCTKASKLAVASWDSTKRIQGQLKRAGEMAKAQAANAEAQARRDAIVRRPALNISAIPNHPLACESCGLNAPALQFSIAWADHHGWGICKKCN